MERPPPMMGHPNGPQFNDGMNGQPGLPGGSKTNMSDYINAALRQIEQSIGDRDPNMPMGPGGPLPPHGMPPGMIPHWDQPPPPGFFPGGPQMMPEMVQFDETSPHHPAFIGFDGLRGPHPPGLMDGGPMSFGHFPPGSEPNSLPPMTQMSAPQHLPPVSGNESRPFDQGHQLGHHNAPQQNHPSGQPQGTTVFNHSPDGSRCSISPRDSGYDSCEVVKHEC